MNTVDQIVKNTAASFAMEGLYLTNETKNSIRKCLLGEDDFDSSIKRIIAKYQKHNV